MVFALIARNTADNLLWLLWAELHGPIPIILMALDKERKTQKLTVLLYMEDYLQRNSQLKNRPGIFAAENSAKSHGNHMMKGLP